jgi:3-isopropylmalate dehydrogenase
MRNYKIALLDGDGIGPEIMREAVKILQIVALRRERLVFRRQRLPRLDEGDM